MFFPNAEVAVNPALLLLLGFMVGVLGGFFGVGGGFLVTPGLLVLGVPPIFAVGTGLALVMGQAIISTLGHRRAGNVDLKLGLLLLGGALPAVFLAERLVAELEAAGLAVPVIRYGYVALLTGLGCFVVYDTWRSRRQGESGRDQVSTGGLIHRVRALRIPPHAIWLPGVGRLPTYVTLPAAGILRLSVFVPLTVGLVVGFMAGLLGAGGGFILLPVLIYVLGVPIAVAIGTGLFQVVVTGSLGTFLYAQSNHVDLLMAVVMLSAASVGSRLGVEATRIVSPRRIRLLFSLTLLGTAAAVALKQLADRRPEEAYLATAATVVLLCAAGSICLVLALQVARAARRGR